MSLWDPVQPAHVFAAVHEYDELGQSRFLEKYGFAPARAYRLLIDDRSYDSKAILGAAYGYATGRALSSHQFSGGVSNHGAAWALLRLGFEVARAANTAVSPGPRRAVSGRTARRVENTSSMVARQAVDVVLVGCVKKKRPKASPARELYTSPLFDKRRRYAEASGRPWFILSALHGLLDPDRTIEPYDMYLARQTAAYRRRWAAQVIADLAAAVGQLEGRVVEIHAGASYVDPLEPLLKAAGARTKTPLRGLTQGQHLAWYGSHLATPTAPDSWLDLDLDAEADVAISALTGMEPAPASEFPWGRTDLKSPGLYAWWVDSRGGSDLGLSTTNQRTLVYAGQAGATRWPSGARSGATLLSRISGQHLRGRISSSTLRQTLAALLRDPLSLRLEAPGVLTSDSEQRLTTWIRDRLAASVWPTHHPDHLHDIEHRVIRRLDPPLNLAGASSNDVRARLAAGRRALNLPTG